VTFQVKAEKEVLNLKKGAKDMDKKVSHFMLCNCDSLSFKEIRVLLQDNPLSTLVKPTLCIHQ